MLQMYYNSKLVNSLSQVSCLRYYPSLQYTHMTSKLVLMVTVSN